MIFCDRRQELSSLGTMSGQLGRKSILCVLYGRRRVGKTELVRQFSKSFGRSIYLFVESKTDRGLLNDLQESVKGLLGVKPHFEGWDDFFEFLFTELGREPVLVVLDEFQNFSRINPGIYSKIQKHWDLWQSKSKVFLVVVGSYVGLMKKLFSDNKEPLFGRADYFINLKPFSIYDTMEFTDGGMLETINLYSVVGGVPKYLLYTQLFETKDAQQLINKLFIEEPAPLREEGKNILISEFGSEHKGYFSILEAIASGKNTQAEIIQYTGLNKDTVAKYLHELIGVYEIVERRHPIGGRPSPRLSRFFMKDNFYRFWFRFIHANKSLLESNPEKLREKIIDELSSYQGAVFEEVCSEILAKLNESKKLPFVYDNIGPWWGYCRLNGERKELEIDLIALAEKSRKILFCECKWQDKVDAVKTLENLKEKTPFMQWHNNDRQEYYCITAKSFKTKKTDDKKTLLIELK